ncbi:DUF6173 family protein [Gemmobacter caeruleus]|uniref:DUF6173 family protein n=1 Tax=Gemmobacter caeruleus TaxID=2595004 RepID=UPI0011EBBE91|nr:DUF6173 family protein [Gemmobacter caeruleus]
MTDEIKTSAEMLEDAALPCAGVVHADPNAPLTPEQQPLPAALARQPVEEKSEAQWAYERLILYIRNFESQLDARHEVAMGFAGGEAGVLMIEGLGYFDPDLVTFYGRDEDGQKMQLVQHVTQLNVVLRAVPHAEPEMPARRIGFRLAPDWDTPTAPEAEVAQQGA